jgi:hypothetical protein
MKDVRSLRNFCSIFLLAAVVLVGCSSSSKKGTTIPTYEKVKKDILAKGPLVKPKVETQHPWLKGGKARGVFKGETVQTVDPKDKTKKVPVVWGAVVIDAKKAAELKAIKDQRDLLLKKLEATKLQRDANKIIYDAALQKAKEAAKRTWWERNKGVVGLAVGGTIIGGLVIGLVYALTRGNGITVNTNAHVLPGVQR